MIVDLGKGKDAFNERRRRAGLANGQLTRSLIRNQPLLKRHCSVKTQILRFLVELNPNINY